MEVPKVLRGLGDFDTYRSVCNLKPLCSCASAMRRQAVSKCLGLCSIPVNCLPARIVATPVEPVPMKGTANGFSADVPHDLRHQSVGLNRGVDGEVMRCVRPGPRRHARLKEAQEVMALADCPLHGLPSISFQSSSRGSMQ